MDDNTNHPEKKSLKEDFDESAVDENLDDSKAKFLGNGKPGLDGEHVVVEVGSSSEASFTGLGKEELMKYATDPFWVRTRMILFVVFWIGWIAMLVLAIIIIVVAPKCPERPNLKWYETDVIYQIFPKSFKDTSAKEAEGAGIGDIKGIQSKLEYLQDDLGVNAFWINSIYKNGEMYDGNDVVDHKAVDGMFGSMEDLKSLRKSSRKKGMKMLLDFIPNHTGKKHEWFEKSENKEEGFEDYYIWADGIGSTTPPNNWVMENGKSAWTYSTTRKQWYFHSYMSEYPDLNLRNKDVLNQLDGVLKFWLDMGVDGFAIQGVQRLVESVNVTEDEGMTGEYTQDQPENLKLVERWRGIINSYSDKPGRERALIARVKKYDNKNDTSADYHTAGLNIVLTDALVDLNLSTCDQTCLKDKLADLGTGRWRGWMVDNENSKRFGSAVDKTMQKAVQVLHMLLPGTAVVYYGDEIAMENGVIPADKKKDPVTPGRDAYRTPMLWNSMPNAGFCNSENEPWLPVNANYEYKSLEYNNAHMVDYTVLQSFKDLVKLRSKEAFQFGSFDTDVVKVDLLHFTRKAKGFPSYTVVINRAAKTTAFGDLADSVTLAYDSAGPGRVGESFNLKQAPIGFQKEEVYVFSY